MSSSHFRSGNGRQARGLFVCGARCRNVVCRPCGMRANPGDGRDFPEAAAGRGTHNIEPRLRTTVPVQQQSAIVDVEPKLHRTGSSAGRREQILDQGIGETLIALLRTGAIDDPVDREGALAPRSLGNDTAVSRRALGSARANRPAITVSFPSDCRRDNSSDTSGARR
jgi:hypothetical protein